MGDRPTSYDKEGLLACARGELFGEGNAQLPMPPMLMMDRITEISEDGGEHGKGHVIAATRLCPVAWALMAFGSSPDLILGIAAGRAAAMHLAWAK